MKFPWSKKPHLFNLGLFALSSGKNSNFKIDCDVLTDEDWDTLAYLALKKLKESFCIVVPVPSGGNKFAAALKPFACGWATDQPILIVDDVLTTGASMEGMRRKHEGNGGTCIGVVAFARGLCPDWVIPIFDLGDLKE